MKGVVRRKVNSGRTKKQAHSTGRSILPIPFVIQIKSLRIANCLATVKAHKIA